MALGRFRGQAALRGLLTWFLFITEIHAQTKAAQPTSPNPTPVVVASVSISNVPAPQGQESSYILTVSRPSIDWSKWITIGVALINLLVVALFAARTRHDRIAERSADRSHEIDAFWMEKLVLEPHFKLIRSFFNETERDMQEYFDACKRREPDLIQRSQAAAERFSKRYDDLSRTVVEPVDIISAGLSAEIAQRSDEIQERVTDFFSRHNFPDDADIIAFRSEQKHFWRTLFDGQKTLGKSAI